METNPYLGPDELLRKKREFLFPCLYHFYSRPMQIVRGEGVYLFDHEGKRYLDCYSGVSTAVLGHAHPEVTAAVREQAGTLVHTTTIYLTQPMIQLAERLAELAPGDLKRSFFCASGSEAVETAVLLAEIYTGRPEVIALKGSLHGRTKLGMSLTGLEMWRTDPFPVPSVTHICNPYCFRCPLGKTFPECGLACAEEVDRAIRDKGEEKVAAILLEPIQGNGGIVVPPPGYLTRTAQIAREHGALLILDEVQTGFGRTGASFACDHIGLVPDVLCLSKSLGNGYPIAATMTTDEIAAAYTRPGASTYGGNLVCATAAQVVLEVLTRDHLAQEAFRLGIALEEWLTQLMERHHLVGDVRGRGLMWGIELVETDGQPATSRTDAVLERLKDDGFLLGKTGPGRNVLTLMPPLVVSLSQLEELVGALDSCLSCFS